MHSSPAVNASSDSKDPQPAPEISISSPKTPAPRSKTRIWIAICAAILAAVFTALIATRRHGTASSKTAVSISNSSGHVLRLKGTTEAVEAQSILAPQLASQQVSTLTLIHLTPGGTRVKKGDLLAEFDRQAQMRDFIDKQAEYQKLVDQVAEEEAKEVAAKAKDQTELKTAEDNLRKTELEMQKEEVVSRIDAEKNQENLEEAKATYAQLKETFELKRTAARAAIRILEIQRDRMQQTMNHAQANASLMQVRAPIAGVAVPNNIWKQGSMGEVQEGDQVEPGTSFMQVVNPEFMQVRVEANQQDYPHLQIGQIGKVHIDAYPDLVLPGKVEVIAPIGEHGSFSEKLRFFAVVIAVEGNNPKLMPDLSAAVDIDIGGQSATETAAGGPR
jgi:multidrug efflux pump subunit AcrA (membrane-fusion protein)